MLAIGQCKAWNKPIGVNLIRELYGVMAAERIKHGVFLTTSIFSQDAIEFAKNKRLLLVDADEFVNLINGLDDINKKRIDHVATEGDYSTPTCVNCDVKMVKRVTKKGTSAGNKFWGCINYPKCKRTMYVKI
jgi:restriction system protein